MCYYLQSAAFRIQQSSLLWFYFNYSWNMEKCPEKRLLNNDSFKDNDTTCNFYLKTLNVDEFRKLCTSITGTKVLWQFCT